MPSVAARSWTSSSHCSQAWKAISPLVCGGEAAAPPRRAGRCSSARPGAPVRAVLVGQRAPGRPVHQRLALVPPPVAEGARSSAPASKTRCSTAALERPDGVPVDELAVVERAAGVGLDVDRVGAGHVGDAQVDRVAEPAGGRQVGAVLLGGRRRDRVQRVDQHEAGALVLGELARRCAGRRGRRCPSCPGRGWRTAAPPSPSRASPRAASTGRGRRSAGARGRRGCAAGGSRAGSPRAARRRCAGSARPRTRPRPASTSSASPGRATIGTRSTRSSGGVPITSRSRSMVAVGDGVLLVEGVEPAGVDAPGVGRGPSAWRRGARHASILAGHRPALPAGGMRRSHPVLGDPGGRPERAGDGVATRPSRTATTVERPQHADVAAPRNADQRRAAEERAVADRGDHADPAGGPGRARRRRRSSRPGSRARPRRPTAARRRRRQRGAGRRRTAAARRRRARRARGPPAPGRSGPAAPGRTSGPPVIAARNTANAERADRGRGAVPVDHRDADPVVAGALGEGEGQHEDADQQRPRLPPGGQRAAPAPAPARRRRASSTSGTKSPRRPAARRRATSDGDARAGGPVTGTSSATIAAPTRAPATVPRLKPAWKRDMIDAAEAPLDHRALHVHRDVPGAVGEAQQEQPDDQQRHAGLTEPTATTRQRDGQQHRHGGDGAAGADPGDHRPGQRQRDAPSRRRWPAAPGPARTGRAPAGRAPAGCARPSWRRRSRSR